MGAKDRTDDIVDLLYGARQRFQTVHAVITARKLREDSGRGAPDLTRIRLEGGKLRYSRGAGGGVTVNDVWLRHPWEIIVRQLTLAVNETQASSVPRVPTDVEIAPKIRGWWAFEFMLDPAMMLASLDFDYQRRDVVLGREVSVVVATRRAGRATSPPQGETFVLNVDRETGLILRSVVTLQGTIVTRDVHELELNSPWPY